MKLMPTYDVPCGLYYRYTDINTEDGPRIYLSRYPVIKETPKGVWLNVYGSRKFVLKESRKRFACQTEAEALNSFIARKKRQQCILTAQLGYVEHVLDRAADMKGEPRLNPNVFAAE